MDAPRIKQTFTIYTLEKPNWIINTGMSKGIFHDKQALGVILQPDTSIRLRHLDPSFEQNLQIELLNFDAKNEQYSPISYNQSELNITHECVPFISTPYTATPSSIDIEIEYSAPPSILPIFNRDTDANEFFKQWNEHQSAFALVTTQYTDVLFPAIDKPRLELFHQNSGLQSMETEYQEVFEYYNCLAGLSFSPDSPTDKNPPNRYFMKADSSGVGFAYYGHNHTAATSHSAGLWIGVNAHDLIVLHEIGHGYQGNIINHGSIQKLGEVWNDIYSHYFQEKHFGEDIFKFGFMYNREPVKFFNDIEELFESKQPVSSWRMYYHRLFYLTLIIDKAEKSAFIDLNRNYRRLSSELEFFPENHPLQDLIASSCAKVANIDISPLLELGQTPLSKKHDTINHYLNGAPAYPLYKLVKKEQLDDILKTLKLNSRLALVDAITLKTTALTGSIELVLEENLFNQISHQEILLRDGTNLSIVVPVTTPTITLEHLPIGVYTLQAPSSIDCKLSITTTHIEVKSDTKNTIRLSHQHRAGTALATQTIELNGFSGTFASIEVDNEYNHAFININSNEPHSLLPGKIFTTISIMDRNQNIVFHKELMGDNKTPSTNKILFGPAYTLEIFHEEPDRNKISPETPSVIDKDNKLSIFELTRQGLKNKNLDTPVEDNLEIRIEEMATKLREAPHLFLHKHHSGRDNISLAIDSFNPIKKAQLEDKYKDLYLSHQNTNPRVVTGNKFIWHQYGLTDLAAIEIEFNLELEIITIKSGTVIPHSYFTSIYLAIWIHNENNNTLLCQELRGDIPTQPFSQSLPFKQGSKISVLHLEPTRAPITNLETGEQYQVMQRHCVRALGQNRLQI